MTHAVTPHAIRVRQVRLHRAGTNGDNNPVALQLAFEQRLQHGYLVPADLPSSAILIIRRMVVESSFQPAGPGGAEWSQGVARQIQTAAQRALRPMVDYVPHDAESVLFWDAVELLTCYTLDVLAQRDRWYWHDLFADQFAGPVDVRLMAGWRAHPTAIPKLLATLPISQARHAIRHLDAHALSETVHLLHAHYRLPDDVFAVEDTGTDRAADPVAAPWDDTLLPTDTAALPPSAAYLLGLSYALVKNPARARSQEFAGRAARWLAAHAGRRASDHQWGDTPDHHRWSDTAQIANTHHAGIIQDHAHGTDQVSGEDAESRLAIGAGQRAANEPVPGTNTAPVIAPEGIYTRLGGVFYLVNVLDWLISVTRSDAAERANRWELIAGLAHNLLGEDIAQYQDDPIWALLDELAGIEPADDRARLAAHHAPMRRSEWWAACVRPVLDSRIRAVIAEPDLSWRDILAAPATIQTTHTHIDVRFSLDQINLLVRRAGLDADPGWQPALGYIVYFHFD